MQYRQRGGFKFGIVPCRRQCGKFEISDDILAPHVNTPLPSSSSPSMKRNYPLIENIGAMDTLVKEAEMVEVDLFAFSKEITMKSAQRKHKKSSVQTV